MKTYGRGDVSIYIFHIFALVGGECQLHALLTLSFGKELPVTNVQEVGPLEPLWTSWRTKNSLPYCNMNSTLSIVQPVTCHYTDCTTLAPFHVEHNKLL
jgi:hypothetical protein